MKETSRFLRSLDVITPAMILDRDRVQRNIRTMADKARAGQARFRPHFKTHQSGAVGRWFAEAGVEAITVSSLAMAEYFAEFGWTDITLAFLLNPLELPRLGVLAGHLRDRGGRLGLTVDSVAAAEALAAAGLPVTVWLKIDTGYGRTGLAWEDRQGIAAVAAALGRNVTLSGLLTHSGHSYAARTDQDLQAVWNTTLKRMNKARQALGKERDVLISVGDTPGCATVPDLAGADEVRPGNFVFFDLMQMEIGSCSGDELAVAVACPVVGLYPRRGRVVLHGGAVHLAKERLADRKNRVIYGKTGFLDIQADGSASLGGVVHEAPVVEISQEHGIIAVEPDRFADLFGDLVIGDLVLVWPVHSCLTCNLFPEYLTLDGEILPRR